MRIPYAKRLSRPCQAALEIFAYINDAVNIYTLITKAYPIPESALGQEFFALEYRKRVLLKKLRAYYLAAVAAMNARSFISHYINRHIPVRDYTIGVVSASPFQERYDSHFAV